MEFSNEDLVDCLIYKKFGKGRENSIVFIFELNFFQSPCDMEFHEIEVMNIIHITNAIHDANSNTGY